MFQSQYLVPDTFSENTPVFRKEFTCYFLARRSHNNRRKGRPCQRAFGSKENLVMCRRTTR